MYLIKIGNFAQVLTAIVVKQNLSYQKLDRAQDEINI